MSTLTRGWAVGTAVAALILTTAPAAPLASAAPLIADDALRACVTERLKLPVGSDPTADQLATVTDLSCSSRQIASLEGAQHLTGLTKAFFADSQISDLTPLGGLESVFSLGLNGNQITDVGPLAGLPLLRSLNIAKNHVSDLRPLAGLPITSISLTAHGQSVTGPAATEGADAARPTLYDRTGTAFHPETAPAGAKVSGTGSPTRPQASMPGPSTTRAATSTAPTPSPSPRPARRSPTRVFVAASTPRSARPALTSSARHSSPESPA